VLKNGGAKSGLAVSEQSEIHEHSGWLIPLAFVLAVAVLSAAFLLYYLRPVPDAFRDDSPSAPARPVAWQIGEAHFAVPGSYLESSGPDRIGLRAALPDFRAASGAGGDQADSPLVHVLIKADRSSLDAATRFARVYQPYLADPAGVAGPFDLRRYNFRAGSGYGGDELYAGRDAAGGLLLLLCERPAPEVPAPNCLSIDRPLAGGLSLSTRFKRAQMGRWREIDAGVQALAARLRKS
jgi:hypothetical protein